MLGFHATKTDLLRMAAVIAIALNAGACSVMPDVPDVPDWVDPTTWFGDDSSGTADSGQTPDLAALPDRPGASTPDDQKKVSESLAADRGHTQYSADALRGGTEAAAAPPPNAPAQAPMVAAVEAPPPSADDSASPPPAPVTKTAQADQSMSAPPSGASIPGSLPAPTPGMRVASVAPPPAEAAPAEAAPAETPAAPPPGAQPAVPPGPAAPMGAIAPSDAALGFRPSSAPPLDPSISQFVAPPIIAHYQQTASNAGMAGAVMAPAAPVRMSRLHKSAAGEGGPETMSGAVVANLDSIEPSTATPSVYASAGGLPAAAVVFFPGDSVALNAEARALVRQAAQQYKANGGQGYIRVIGHSSSRTANMPVERHLEVIFQKSQARAQAVAQELIKEGIPASKVLVEAVGDSQPVYYESMPKGEDGNRRAEIFLQG